MALLTPVGGLWLNPDTSPTTSTLNDKACLIDGNVTDACVTDSANYYLSVGANLGESKSIGSVIVRFYKLSITATWSSTAHDGFSLYTSDNGTSWTLRQSWDGPTIFIDGTDIGHVELVLSTPVSAQYVKIHAKDSYGWWVSPGSDSLKVTEIEISDPSATFSVPVSNLTLSAHQGIQLFPIFTPVALLAVTTHEPSFSYLVIIDNAAALSLTPVIPVPALSVPLPATGLVLSAGQPSYIWSIPARNRPAAQVIYTCTLTGDGESPAVSDLTFPMSSFQGRMRDGDPSYISAVIPNCMVYADDILARQNGDIVIKKGYRFQDGSTQLEEIARVDFESVRIDQGSKSASATISGHKTISSTSVKTVTVEGVSYYCLQADGKRRIRALLDLFLRIGDTCIYGTGESDYMTVGYITYTVSVNQTIMEVTEA